MGIRYMQGYVVKCDQPHCQESLEFEEPMSYPPITMMNKKGWEYDAKDKKCYCPSCAKAREDVEKIKQWCLKKNYQTTVIYDSVFDRFALSIEMPNKEYEHFFADTFYEALDKVNRLWKWTGDNF